MRKALIAGAVLAVTAGLIQGVACTTVPETQPLVARAERQLAGTAQGNDEVFVVVVVETHDREPVRRGVAPAPDRVPFFVTEVQLPNLVRIGPAVRILTPEVSGDSQPGPPFIVKSYFVRGRIQRQFIERLRATPGVTVFDDPPLSMVRSSGGGGSPEDDVVAGLGIDDLVAAGMDGSHVLIGVVDAGFGSAELQVKAACPDPADPAKKVLCFDADRSDSVFTPVGRNDLSSGDPHATMVAYDALIAAPHATLTNLVLSPTSRVSDAGELFNHLAEKVVTQGLLSANGAPGIYRGIVVVNSWAIYDPQTNVLNGDFATNIAHPTNLAVAGLAAVGVDVVFAAGNCGDPKPDGSCTQHGASTIYGANSHPDVLSVAAVGVFPDNAGVYQRWGYSSQGPGSLDPLKPDVATFSEFAASGLFAMDSGTSAAAPLAAGVLAAYRSTHPAKPGGPSPAGAREAMRNATRFNCAKNAWNADIGYGVLGPACLLPPPPTPHNTNGGSAIPTGTIGRHAPH